VIIEQFNIKRLCKIYKYQLQDVEKMNRELKESINKFGQIQNKKETNEFNNAYRCTSAKMTPWTMHAEKGFKDIYKIVEDIVNSKQFHSTIPLDGDYKLPIKVRDLWGLEYWGGDETIEHNHEPAAYSFAYYIGKGVPIVFTEINHTIKASSGLLIIFPAYLKHKVSKCDGERYVVSGNILV